MRDNTLPKPSDRAFQAYVRESHAKEDLARLMKYVGECTIVPKGGAQTDGQLPVQQALATEAQGILKAALRHLNPSNKHPDSMIEDAIQGQVEKELSYAQFGLCLQLLAWKTQRVVSVIASKGGAGKTPLISLLAALYAWITNVSTLLIEGNENAGTIDGSSGVSRSDVKVLLTDAINDHELINTHRKCGENLGRHLQTGLNVLLSDSNNKNNQFTLKAFLDMFDVLSEQHYATFGDTGNGMGITKAANTGLLLKSHVILFPLVADNYSTYQPLLTTMLDMYRDGHTEKLKKYSRIVINATGTDYTLDHFFEKMLGHAADMTSGDKGEASDYAEWKDNPVQLLIDLGFDYNEEEGSFTGKGIFMIPYSQWIAENKVISILPEDIGQETLAAGLEILFECLTMDIQTDKEMYDEIERVLAMVAEYEDTRRHKSASTPSTPINIAGDEHAVREILETFTEESQAALFAVLAENRANH